MAPFSIYDVVEEMDVNNYRLAVYTALFGDYDSLIEPKERFEGCDFICFTDQINLKSNIWEIRIIEKCDLPPNIMNRKYKILPHLFLSEYDWSLYVDANIIILRNPIDLAKKYLGNYYMVLPKHFARTCIYDEAKECTRLGKANYEEIKIQMDKYKREGFPANFGLGENNILLRKHNSENIIKIMNEWWHEFNTHAKRDQLSLGYVLWKNGEKFHFMDESARGGNYFRMRLHAHEISKGVLGKIKNLTNEHTINCPNGLIAKIIRIAKIVLK